MRHLIVSLGLVITTAFILVSTSHALYHPGSLKASKTPVNPPPQEAVPKGFWKVEEGILIHHFEHGEGPPVLVIHGGPGIPPGRPWAGLKEFDHAYRFIYYHQRGCGESTRPVDRFESKDFYQNMIALDKALGMVSKLADIERIRRILGQDKLILIGH